MVLTIVAFVLVGLVIVLFLTERRLGTYFKRRGLKTYPEKYSLVAELTNIVSPKEHIKDLATKIYNVHPGEKYIGVGPIFQVLIVLRDLELIKHLAIKEFDHFVDHLGSLDDTLDPLFGNSLFFLRGQKWRDMRATLSPAFTSSKMRGMFDFVAECGEQMSNYYVKKMDEPENKVRGLVEVEMKDAFTRYTNDVIATTAFGIKVDSLVDRENEFYMVGKDVSDFSGTRMIRFFVAQLLPKVAKFFNIQIFSKELRDFCHKLVIGTMNQREEQNIVRPDMIQLLMEARKGALKHEEGEKEGTETGFATVEESSLGKQTNTRKWTDNDIVAQAVLFFVAGFDTSSILLCFLTDELAKHPDIQKKLQEEIDEVAAKNNGKVTYNDLHNMKYMDMVVSETLRMWPPLAATDRNCVKPIKLPPPSSESSQDFEMKVGEAIWIPIYAIHHDPQYFKDPEVFDPERFSDENKANIQPFSYMPFGIGPRNCIGSRFALMEAKAVIFHLLHKFDLMTTAKTENPVKLKKSSFNLQAQNGFWMGLKPRVSTL